MASHIHPGKSTCELLYLLAHKASWWRHWLAFLHFAPLPWLCGSVLHLAARSWWKSSGAERHSNHIRWMQSLYVWLWGLKTFVWLVPVEFWRESSTNLVFKHPASTKKGKFSKSIHINIFLYLFTFTASIIHTTGWFDGLSHVPEMIRKNVEFELLEWLRDLEMHSPK